MFNPARSHVFRCLGLAQAFHELTFRGQSAFRRHCGQLAVSIEWACAAKSLPSPETAVIGPGCVADSGNGIKADLMELRPGLLEGITRRGAGKRRSKRPEQDHAGRESQEHTFLEALLFVAANILSSRNRVQIFQRLGVSEPSGRPINSATSSTRPRSSSPRSLT